MVATIPDLWPGLKLDTLSPATILRQQVAYIRVKGNGILDAELTTVTGTGDFIIHRLDLIAPILDRQKYRVLTATHRSDYYPVQIEADCYRTPDKTSPYSYVAAFAETLAAVNTLRFNQQLIWPAEGDWRPVASDQESFLSRIKEVLASKEVRAAIESFIARSNEQNAVSSRVESPA